MRTYATWRLFKDGPHWIATAPGFINLERSPCGYGETQQEAVEALLAEPVIKARLTASGRCQPKPDAFIVETSDVDLSADWHGL